MQKDGKRETEASVPQKCVQVADEAGNRYEATYPKRAKGLVKNGRARFTDESQTAIILTCPPNQTMILEDNTMNEQIQNTEVNENESAATEVAATETTVNEAAPALTAKEVFDQISALQRQMMDQSYNSLYRMTEAVNDICSDDTFESDESRENAINQITSVFMAREENYRHLMAFYQQMYNDFKPQNEAKYAERREFMNWVRDCIDATQCGQDLPDFERLWKIFGS